jgi:hydroxymethylglutaryl-CoA lyase
LRAYVSTAFVCPYEGPVDPGVVVAVLRSLRDLDIDTFSIGDTVGKAHPAGVNRLLDAIEDQCPSGSSRRLEGLALHLHDTLGHALENVRVGLTRGIEEFDSSAGGLGGCPFAPGASGNLATESLVELLDGMGIGTGIDLELQRNASQTLKRAIDRSA